MRIKEDGKLDASVLTTGGAKSDLYGDAVDDDGDAVAAASVMAADGGGGAGMDDDDKGDDRSDDEEVTAEPDDVGDEFEGVDVVGMRRAV